MVRPLSSAAHGCGRASVRANDRNPSAGKFLGRTGTVELMVQAPGGVFSGVDVAVEQNGKTFPVYTLDPQKPDASKLTAPKDLRDAADRQAGDSELQAGPARIVVRASRPVVYGLRQAESTATRDVQVRLDPPRASPVSTFHFINLGGSEFVVYRAHLTTWNRVCGSATSSAPATGKGRRHQRDPALRVAFFVLFDQDPRSAVQGVRARPGGQRSGGARRPPGVPEAMRQEHDSPRRRIPAEGGAGHRQQRAGREDPDRRRPGGLPEDQWRPPEEEQSVPDGALEEECPRAVL